MTLEAAIPLISLVTALIALGGVIYGFAFKWGRADRQLSDLSRANVVERLIKMETKIEVMWTAFTEQLLANRPHLASKGSRYRLSQEACDAISEVKDSLPDKEDNGLISEKVLLEVPYRIGMGRLREIAARHSITIGELLALISVELGIEL